MKTFAFLTAALLFLSGCQTLRDVENPLATAYSGFDADGDGVISQQEAQASPNLAENFDRIDTNRSGGIDDKEYQAANMHIDDLRFEQVDVNEDGVVSEREAAAMPVSLKEAFGDIDTDGDNNVSPQEYEAATTNLLAGLNFAELDADGDGVIGEAEAKKMPPLSEAFHRVDSDADNLISEKEFVTAQR
jgi:Ca2+-binding EF-hand superfamily protein